MRFSRSSSPLPSHNSPSPSSTPHHNLSETAMEENIIYAETIIKKWDLQGPSYTKISSLFVDERTDAKRFIEAVNGLQNAMHYYSKLSTNSDKLIRTQNLMHIAMKRLEVEFYTILSSNKSVIDSDTVSGRSSVASTRYSLSDLFEDENSENDESTSHEGSHSIPEPGEHFSSIVMADLKSIADCMISSGYGKECVTIYHLVRKSIIDEALYYLGIEKPSSSQIQKMDWNVLEIKIKSWLNAVKIATRTLFYNERVLCDTVFSSSDKIKESCFTDITRDAAINLFVFPENFAKSKKILSPEKMFRTLDLYEALSDMLPELELIFSYDSLSSVKMKAVASIVKLGEAVRMMLIQFESAIQKDSSKAPAGGNVHPLTRYVMNYLVFLEDYSGAVADIVADWPMIERTPLPESYFSSPLPGGTAAGDSAFAVKLAWLVLVLLCKLDGKATLYNDVALSYLFLANNLNYVVSKVKNSNVRLLMGSEWISAHESKVRKYAANYERMGWIKVMASLPEDPTADLSPDEANQMFSRFYSGFEEAYRKQISWVIPDPNLRDRVKISLAKNVLPRYRILYEKYRGENVRVFGGGSMVRYAPEDLNNYFSDLFFEAPKTSSYAASSDSSMS